MYRGAARPGDDIWVSGELGGAALALAAPRARVRSRAVAPPGAARRARRALARPRACRDRRVRRTGRDLGHILERSQVGAVVEYARLPKPAAFEKFRELERDCVLSGGDDYELLFTAGQAERGDIEALGRELKVPLARIGVIQAGAAKLVVLDAGGKPMAYRGGFDHFAPSAK
jgi:thiamine-monophosphate kinase